METVTISLERLRELENAATTAVLVPTLRARLAKRNNNNLERLRAHEAAHPELAKERRKRYNEAHREEINEKQREKRKRAREAAAAAKNLTGMAPLPPLHP